MAYKKARSAATISATPPGALAARELLEGSQQALMPPLLMSSTLLNPLLRKGQQDHQGITRCSNSLADASFSNLKAGTGPFLPRVVSTQTTLANPPRVVRLAKVGRTRVMVSEPPACTTLLGSTNNVSVPPLPATLLLCHPTLPRSRFYSFFEKSNDPLRPTKYPKVKLHSEQTEFC